MAELENTPEDLPQEKQRRKRFRMWVTFPFLLLLLFLIGGFSSNFIPSESMETTLKSGDHIIVMRSWLAYPMNKMPARGDIVVFRLPEDVREMAEEGKPVAEPAKQGIAAVFDKFKGSILIKRVVGLPGETVQIVKGQVLINGNPLKMDHAVLQEDLHMGAYYPYAVEKPLIIPPGHLFVLGDNRNNSDDGRYWGTLKRSHVRAKFLFVLYHENKDGHNSKKADALNAEQEQKSQ